MTRQVNKYGKNKMENLSISDQVAINAARYTTNVEKVNKIGRVSGNRKIKGSFTVSIYKSGIGGSYLTFYDIESANKICQAYKKDGYTSHIHIN